MSSRRSDALISKLGASLAKPPTLPGKVSESSAAPATPELAAKISISLYTDDLARVDAIVAHMAQSRCRVNRSEAIKIALRGLKLTPELATIHRDVQRDDGRRKHKTNREA
jgi:hypothetical protein